MKTLDVGISLGLSGGACGNPMATLLFVCLGGRSGRLGCQFMRQPYGYLAVCVSGWSVWPSRLSV